MINLDKERPPSQLPKENLLSLGELASRTPKGNFLELGVYKGGSAWVLSEVAKAQDRKLFLFDTFTGLPNERPGQQMGAGGFADTSKELVQGWIPEALIYKGLFPDTLTDLVTDLAFIHIDCDLLNGCKSALELLWPRTVPGGIIAFDDWGFDEIQKPVVEKFGRIRVKFTDIKIPYVVKE